MSRIFQIIQNYRNGVSISAEEARTLCTAINKERRKGQHAALLAVLDPEKDTKDVHLKGSSLAVQQKQIDFVGFVIGAALGDALLLGVEMVNASDMEKLVPYLLVDYVSVRGATNSEKTGKFAVGHVVGDYSDDAEETVANMIALKEADGVISPPVLLHYYVKEYEKSRNSLGVARQGHGSIRPYLEKPSEDVIKKIRDKARVDPFPGNAPAMRAAIFGLFPFDSILNRAIVNANVTHPHVRARMSSYIIALTCHYFAVMHLVDFDDAVVRQNLIPFIISSLDQAHSRVIQGNMNDERSIYDESFVQYLRRVDTLSSREGPFINTCGPLVDPNDRVVLVGNENGLKPDAVATAGVVLWLLKFANFQNLHTLYARCAMIGGDVDSCTSIVFSIVGAMGLIDYRYCRANGCQFLSWALDSLENTAYLACVGQEFQAWQNETNLWNINK